MLCDRTTGFGWDPDRFIVDDLVGLAQDLDGDEWRLSPVLREAIDEDTLIERFLSYWDGYRYTHRGKIGFGRRPSGSTVHLQGVTELTYHQFLKQPDLKRKSAKDATNQLTVKVTSPDDDQYKEVAVTLHAPANRQLGRLPKKEEIEASWILGEGRGMAWGRAALQRLGAERIEGKVSVPREDALRPDGEPLRVGDVVLIDQHVIEQDHYFRIKAIEEGEEQGELVLEVESERGQFPTPYVAPVEEVPAPERPPATPFAEATVIELPAALSGGGLAVAALFERGDGDVGGRVWFSPDGTSYVLLGVVTTPAFKGVLTSDAGVGAGELAVETHAVLVDILEAQEGLSQADDTLLAIVGGEVCSVGSVTPGGDGAYTVGGLRGRRGTDAAAHATGAAVWFVRRADIKPLANSGFLYGEEAHFKVQPVNWAGQVIELSDDYFDAAPGKVTLTFGYRAVSSDVTVTSSASAFYTTYNADGSTTTTPSSITLACEAAASIPEPSYQWETWSGAAWAAVAGASAATLERSPGQEGRYRCEVTGGGGAIVVVSGAIEITAAAAPVPAATPIDVGGVKVAGVLVLTARQAARASTFVAPSAFVFDGADQAAKNAQYEDALNALRTQLLALGTDVGSVRTGLSAAHQLFEA